MKIAGIIACLALSVVVYGNMFAAAVRGIEPVILSLGAAAFAALGQNSDPMHDVSHFKWENIFGSKNGNKKLPEKEDINGNLKEPRHKKAKDDEIPEFPKPVYKP